jgi:hypothetical protein
MKRDNETRAALARVTESHRLLCEDGEIPIWRDFDTEETRMRTVPGAPVIRVKEDAMCDLFNEDDRPITDERVRTFLCDIARRPDSYGHLLVGGRWPPATGV